MRVELLLAPDCPLADAARLVVSESTNQLGLKVSVAERIGDFPSPTVLVDGIDVMTGSAGAQHIQACRLGVPTISRMLEALRQAISSKD
ncbi:MAG TPA: alkylmercury lyase [Micromonosporaceae bacterium]|nr:alkylmercury lyase [Micromonosporaceae bacterium]HCU51578.1 alkylmercury lyase [Micromonosporaceae bacterium]